MDQPLERIDRVRELAPNDQGIRKPSPFIDSPADFLAKWVCLELKKDKVWTRIFGDFIDPYPRDDYQLRNLPCLRIHNKGYTKSFESWFVEGDLFIDILMPADLRRAEKEEVPDVLSNALMQQFRRPNFFAELCRVIPGLNELGKMFVVDKDLAYAWESETIPLTRIRANFRIDLREWDLHLEETYRTKDDPFERTLGDLEKLVGVIQAYREETLELEMGIESDTLCEEED